MYRPSQEQSANVAVEIENVKSGVKKTRLVSNVEYEFTNDAYSTGRSIVVNVISPSGDKYTKTVYITREVGTIDGVVRFDDSSNILYLGSDDILWRFSPYTKKYKNRQFFFTFITITMVTMLANNPRWKIYDRRL